jgi:hypothetical protein
MGKVWVLDSETKGTGANVVPLDKVLKKPAPPTHEPDFLRRRPRQEDAPEPTPDPEPRLPRKFKVVDVMTRQVVAEGADARTTLGVLEKFRSLVDVDIFVWDRSRDRWRPISMAEKRTIWGFRDLTG